MIIVFDIGGTNMRIAGVEDGVLGIIRKVPTPKDFEKGVGLLVRTAREIAGENIIETIAGCAAGSVENGIITDARNLRDWQGHNLAERIGKELNAATTIVNDAAAAGLGEDMHGAGKGSSNLAYVTVSTGVGGAHIVSGAIQEAGGVGHTPVRGSDLESLVSGTAVRNTFGIEPKELESLEERNKLADILSEGLAIITNRWRPDTIILGGSMITGVNPIPLERVRATLFSLMPNPPVITMAELGDSGGLYGAMILAQRLIGSH